MAHLAIWSVPKIFRSYLARLEMLSGCKTASTRSWHIMHSARSPRCGRTVRSSQAMHNVHSPSRSCCRLTLITARPVTPAMLTDQFPSFVRTSCSPVIYGPGLVNCLQIARLRVRGALELGCHSGPKLSWVGNSHAEPSRAPRQVFAYSQTSHYRGVAPSQGAESP